MIIEEVCPRGGFAEFHIRDDTGGGGPLGPSNLSLVIRVAYLGPEGTFTEEALRTQADLVASETIPVRSVPEVFATVERGEAELGLVPIENAIEGAVALTLDVLAFESELLIQREVDLPISLNLCARPGTTLRDVRSILTMPMAVGQCREWLELKLPGVEVRAANSTAEAAQEVSRSRKAGIAAIANAGAAKKYGLKNLATAIEDHDRNQTRFVLLGRGVPAPTGHDRTSIVCFQRSDRPGSLLAMLQEFAARTINLTKVESRPTKHTLGDYCFFIDFEGHVSEPLVADCLRTLAAKQAKVKFLGSYPVAGSGAVARRSAAGKSWRDANSWVDALQAQVRSEDE
ncbi:MAG: prephenate dehydratase [Actinobacteria bacterium]|nr:prephenate dehydratase [Actinomycetota bacterium]